MLQRLGRQPLDKRLGVDIVPAHRVGVDRRCRAEPGPTLAGIVADPCQGFLECLTGLQPGARGTDD